jgi:hypothetical protein
MRREHFPEHSLPLKRNVGDIEYGQEPGVSITMEIEIFFHASDIRISREM